MAGAEEISLEEGLRRGNQSAARAWSLYSFMQGVGQSFRVDNSMGGGTVCWSLDLAAGVVSLTLGELLLLQCVTLQHGASPASL